MRGRVRWTTSSRPARITASRPVHFGGPRTASAAPRIDDRLVVLITRVDDGRRPIAETNRLVGAAAEHLSLTRPSYEQVRVHVHANRVRRAATGIGSVALDVAFHVQPPQAILDALAGTAATQAPGRSRARRRAPPARR